MARNPIDTAQRVSTRLAEFIESQCNDPEVEQPITLCQLRQLLGSLLPESAGAGEGMQGFDAMEADVHELDALIEEYGEDALAVDFLSVSASEPLSRVIESVMNDENREYVATLGTVREAMSNGLLTRLVGDGVLDEDEDDSLCEEIDGLIERAGADALAENFLRYE